MIRECQKGYVHAFLPPSDDVRPKVYESGYQYAKEVDMFGLSLRADEPVKYYELKGIESVLTN